MFDIRTEHDELTKLIRQALEIQIEITDEISTKGIAYEVYKIISPDRTLPLIIKNLAFEGIKKLVQKEIDLLSPLQPECSDHEKGAHILIDGVPMFILQSRYDCTWPREF